jgi:hypothetical protein
VRAWVEPNPQPARSPTSIVLTPAQQALQAAIADRSALAEAVVPDGGGARAAHARTG